MKKISYLFLILILFFSSNISESYANTTRKTGWLGLNGGVIADTIEFGSDEAGYPWMWNWGWGDTNTMDLPFMVRCDIVRERHLTEPGGRFHVDSVLQRVKAANYSGYVMVFNEPDLYSQDNCPPDSDLAFNILYEVIKFRRENNMNFKIQFGNIYHIPGKSESIPHEAEYQHFDWYTAFFDNWKEKCKEIDEYCSEFPDIEAMGVHYYQDRSAFPLASLAIDNIKNKHHTYRNWIIGGPYNRQVTGLEQWATEVGSISHLEDQGLAIMEGIIPFLAFRANDFYAKVSWYTVKTFSDRAWYAPGTALYEDGNKTDRHATFVKYCKDDGLCNKQNYKQIIISAKGSGKINGEFPKIELYRASDNTLLGTRFILNHDNYQNYYISVPINEDINDLKIIYTNYYHNENTGHRNLFVKSISDGTTTLQSQNYTKKTWSMGRGCIVNRYKLDDLLNCAEAFIDFSQPNTTLPNDAPQATITTTCQYSQNGFKIETASTNNAEIEVYYAPHSVNAAVSENLTIIPSSQLSNFTNPSANYSKYKVIVSGSKNNKTCSGNPAFTYPIFYGQNAETVVYSCEDGKAANPSQSFAVVDFSTCTAKIGAFNNVTNYITGYESQTQRTIYILANLIARFVSLF